MKYPDKAEIGGITYPIHTSWRTGVKCMEIAGDPNISDEERALAIIYTLFGFVPEDHLDDFLRISIQYLSCGEPHEQHRSRKKDMDFVQDERYITASFASDYHIDLESEDMHFWRYCALLSGLTEHCVLSRVREIRNYDLSDLKDVKSRTKMADAKRALALREHVSEDEQSVIDEFERLLAGGDN